MKIFDTTKPYPVCSPPKRATAGAPLLFWQNDTVVLAERQWGASGGTLGRAVEGVELRRVQALDPIAETRWPRGVEVGVERAGGEGGSSCAHRKFSALSGVCLVFTPPPPPPPSEQAKTSPFDEDSGNVPCVAQDDLPAVAQLLTFRHLFEAHEAVFPTLEDGAATAPSTPYTKRNHKRAEKEVRAPYTCEMGLIKDPWLPQPVPFRRFYHGRALSRTRQLSRKTQTKNLRPPWAV